MAEPYVLRADGRHEADVKWVCPMPATTQTLARLLSASRDRTAASWILPGKGAGEKGESRLEQALTFTGHTNFVNFVVYVDKAPCFGDDPVIITGAHDKNVLVFNVATSALDAALVGHDDVVKSGCLCPGNRLLTGSWDNSAVVWDLNTGTLAKRVRAHTNNIHCVVAFGDDEGLSASGDRTIARFKLSTGEVLGRYAKHEDTVQAVVSLERSAAFKSAFECANLFASAGNDGNIFVWDADKPKQAPLARFTGHESIIYQLSVNPHTGDLLSAGDDNTLRIWEPTKCAQCLFHPSLVWSSAVYDDEDVLVTACADGAVRVWTRDVGDMASADQVEQLEQTIAATKLAARITLNGANPTSLPTVEEALAEPGSFEGQRTLGRNGDYVEAYAWVQGRWDKIGIVVASGDDDGSGVTKPKKREKVFHNGEWYDYVFDVEISGVPLKLTYNRGQSVFDAAQMFIYDYSEMGISQMDKEQIQQHILNNIDPEDAALVGGAVGAPAGSGGGDANVAFSAYAKELAEMQKAGTADNKGSYRDEFARMEAAGEVPSFSTYAQEEAAAKGGAVPQPAGAGASTTIQEMIAATAADADLFTGFAADGARKRLVEFGVAEADAASMTQQVAADAPATSELVVRILVAIDALQPGQRFPAVDMLRCLAARSIDAFADHAEGVAAVVCEGLKSTAEADAERLVSLRCLHNMFAHAAASRSADAKAVAAVTPLFAPDALAALQIAMRRATSRVASANLKAAGLRVMASMSIAVSRCADLSVAGADLEAAAKSLVSYVALGLIIELDNANVRRLVRAALVILCGPNTGAEAPGSVHPVRMAAREAAVKEIFGIVRAKKEYGDPDVVAGCKHIYALLSPLAPV
eukprot:CAMPEP_0174832320 /NCGR_PEP_ID=MMETSP1114-20130205/3611_1 /TAXON_ID=312471 /ORGANISM="Neobodo designis, Strain CCAP 1951/1" /LENGTH=866 /DNA_ID=CAMNT_0016066175 /DNA_START=42 /DNA_END=2642 /DNA_ORIENTATION=-